MMKLDTQCPLSVRGDALARPMFPPPSLKFRTAGFPQYGFKSAFDRNLRCTAHTVQLICGQKSRRCALVALTGTPSSWTGNRVSALTGRSRGPWLACGLCCPAGSSLTMASSEALGPSNRFMSYPAGLCHRRDHRQRRGSRDSPIYSASPSLRAVSRTPSDRVDLGCGCSTRAAFAISAEAGHPIIHASRFTRGCVTRLQSSLHVAARRFACPSSTRAFTFELSFHESPH